MTMRLVERMTETPPHCMVCGKGNTPNGDTKLVEPAVDLGTDRNWGDSCYLCTQCAEKVGALVGMATPDTVKDLEHEKKALLRKVHDLEADIDVRRSRERELRGRVRSLA